VKVTNNTILLFLVLILSSELVHAQNEEQFPLRNILDSLETKFDITFTYLDENVNGIYLASPPQSYDLDQILNYLFQKTQLEFQKIDDKYIAISKQNNELIDICGYLTDNETEDPLFGASIEMEDRFTITDEKGFFNIEGVTKESILLIRSLGYQPKEVPISIFGSDCAYISLDIRSIALGEIIIPDYLTMGINKKVDGSFALKTQQLGILPGLMEPDLMYSIQTLPGIQSINETVSDINVRGGTNDQNLVLWDGIRMYQSGHFFGLISVYNPYLTKEVDLIKNGTEASLGDGVSSTISIQTEDEILDKITGGAGINMLYGDIFLKMPISKKASLNISGRRSIGDLVKTPTYKQYFSRAFRDTDVFNSSLGADSLATSDENFYFYDVNVNFIYNFSKKDQLCFNFLNILNEIEFQENAIVNNITESKTSSLNQQTLASNLSLSRLWNPKLRTSANFYFSKYNLDALNVNLFDDQRLIQENEVLDIGLKLDTRASLSNTVDILMGYQLSEVGISNLEDINNPDFRRLVKNVLITHSGFVEVNHSSEDKRYLKLGLRVNYFDKLNRWTVEPRLSFNQPFLKYFSFELLGELKSQTTTQIIDFQTDFLGVEKRRWTLVNGEDIPVIQSKQASVGILFNKNNNLISIETYLKEVSGINSLSQGFQNQFQFINTTGSYDVKGIDFLMSRKMGNINSWTSYSYSKNSFEFPELVPSSFPGNLDITHTVSVGSSYQNTKWELSIGLNWHTGKPYTQPSETDPVIEGEINYDFPNSSRLEDYIRLDFSAIYNFPIGSNIRAQTGFSIWNILDHENVINAYYVLDTNDQIQLVQQKALAFTPNLMFRINF
jgi:hypothetical protein